MTAGKHTFIISKDDWVSEEIEVELEVGVTKTMTIKITQIAAASESATG